MKTVFDMFTGPSEQQTAAERAMRQARRQQVREEQLALADKRRMWRVIGEPRCLVDEVSWTVVVAAYGIDDPRDRCPFAAEQLIYAELGKLFQRLGVECLRRGPVNAVFEITDDNDVSRWVHGRLSIETTNDQSYVH